MNKNLITSKVLGFPISQTIDEVVCLMKYARQVKATDTIIDVGTRNGGTALVLAIASGARVVSIDVLEDPREPGFGYGEIPSLKEHWLNHKQDKIEQVTCVSWEYVHNGDTIGLVLLDGSHEYEDVKRDFEHFYPVVKPGGWILFHDYEDYPGVTRFVDELAYPIVDRAEKMVVIRREDGL